MSSIQLAYHNSFRSIWEYEEAFLKEKIDWKSVIGPYQLIPYYLYTLETILKALLLWLEYCKDEEFSGTSYEVEQSLPAQSRVTSWQLHKWLMMIRHGFLTAHGELSQRFDFSPVPRETDIAGHLDIVHGYLVSISRGPPVRMSAVLMALKIYCQIADRFLFGHHI